MLDFGFYCLRFRLILDAMAGAIATNGVGVKVEDTKIVVVMVGLPARGKSLIAQKSKLDPKTNTHGAGCDFL